MPRANSGAKAASSRSKSNRSGSRGGSERSKRSSTRKSSSQSGGRSARGSSSHKRTGGDLPDYSIIDPEEIDESVDVYVDAPVSRSTRSSSSWTT